MFLLLLLCTTNTHKMINTHQGATVVIYTNYIVLRIIYLTCSWKTSKLYSRYARSFLFFSSDYGLKNFTRIDYDIVISFDKKIVHIIFKNTLTYSYCLHTSEIKIVNHRYEQYHKTVIQNVLNLELWLSFKYRKILLESKLIKNLISIIC